MSAEASSELPEPLVLWCARWMESPTTELAAMQELREAGESIAQHAREEERAVADKRRQDHLRLQSEASNVHIADLIRERDEARAYGERLYAECSGNARGVTCVWCGHAFEEGTPASQDDALYKHALSCAKHPTARAVAAEREACALLAWELCGHAQLAAAIRARGEQP